MGAAKKINRDIGFGPLPDKIFDKLNQLAYQHCGVTIKSDKKFLFQTRINRRLRDLKFSSYEQYCGYIFSSEGKDEVKYLIDVVTTHTTYFFREANQFEFLTSDVIPELVAHMDKTQNRKLNIWSAACSTGEEVYTLSIVFNEYLKVNPNVGFNYNILGTDVSEVVVEQAQRGIYPIESLKPLDIEMKRKYFMRGKGKASGYVKTSPELQINTKFKTLNFFQKNFGFENKFDVIFCRNVIIYFNREDQIKVLNRLCDNLRKGGYLFMGHTESLANFDLPVERIGPTVYRRL